MRLIYGYGQAELLIVAMAMMATLGTSMAAHRLAVTDTCIISVAAVPAAWAGETDKGSKGPCDHKEDCGNLVREDGCAASSAACFSRLILPGPSHSPVV